MTIKDYRLALLLPFWMIATLCLGGVAGPYERIHVVVAAIVSAFLLYVSSKKHPTPENAEPFPLSRVVFWMSTAMLCLALVQLIPLPAWLLGDLSPIKRELTFDTLDALKVVPSKYGYPISIDPSATFVFLAQALAFLSVLAASVETMRSQEMRRYVAWGIAAFSAAVGFVGTAHRFSGSQKLLWFLDRGWTFFGPYVNANHAGALLAVGGTLALSLSYRRQPRTSQALLSIFFFSSALGLLNTGSRAAILALGITSLLQLRFRLAASKQDPLAKQMLLPAITLTIILALLWQAPSLSRLGTTKERFVSGTELRPEIWSAAVSLWKKSPVLGIGFGAFPKASPLVLGSAHFLKVEHAENEYLELLSNGGIIAALLGAALLFLIIRRIIRTLRSTETSTATRAFALATSAMLIDGFFVFHAPLPAHQILFAILLGGLFSSHRYSVLKTRTAKTRTGALLSLTFVLGVACIFPHLSEPHATKEPPLMPGGSRTDRKAAAIVHQSEVDALSQTLRLDPTDPAVLYALAVHLPLAGSPAIGAYALKAAEKLSPFDFAARSSAIEALAASGAFSESLIGVDDLLSGPYPLPQSALLRLHFDAAYYALRLDKDAQIAEHLNRAERIDSKDWRLPLLRSLTENRKEDLLLESWKRSAIQQVAVRTWDESLATLIFARPKAYDVGRILRRIGPYRRDAGIFLKEFSRFLRPEEGGVAIRLDGEKKSPRLAILPASAAESARFAPLVDPLNDPETFEIAPARAHAELDLFYLPVDLTLAPKELSFRMVVESTHSLSTQLVVLIDGKPRITPDPARRVAPNRWELTFRRVGDRIPIVPGELRKITGVGFTPLERPGRYSVGPIELFVDSTR